MEHFAGLDVSVKDTSVRILDDAGKIVRELRVASEPEALSAVLKNLRGTLRNFGLKVGIVGKVKFEARIKELVENIPDLAVLVEPLLIVRRVLREQVIVLHRRLLAIVRDDDVCRRLMTVPGVGPVVSLTSRHRRRARSLPQI